MLSKLLSCEILICAGCGGVGKTSLAAGLGLAAARRGKRVLVITIDPSQRLKTTLGISDSGEVCEVALEQTTGQLFAAVVNPKKVFDDFVRRAAARGSDADLLLKNSLYQQLTTSLSGSQEFTALEFLYQHWSQKQYDLIVLDTPPAKHAMDFLRAPEKLAFLFQDSVTSWFRNPEGAGLIRRMFHQSTQQVFRALEIMTGSEFMKELVSFFRALDGWQKKLEDRMAVAHSMLTGPHCHFVLVTSPDPIKLQEASAFAKELRRGGYQLKGIVVNRARPFWMSPTVGSDKSQPEPTSVLINEKMDWTEVRKIFALYQQQTEERIGQFLGDKQSMESLLRIPELRAGVSDLDGVRAIADEIATSSHD